MKEEWRAVPGYEGLYEVSNCGRVRSLDGMVVTKRGVRKNKAGVILRSVIGKKGYCVVGLGTGNRWYVHRLVAVAFLPNPNNLPMVNHKDENRANNKVDNLEWCDNRYNLNYGSVKDKMRRHCSIRKPVLQIDKEGNVVNEFESLSDASKCVGVHYQNITFCCKHNSRTAGGYKWKYKTD